jgi:two-component system, LytTR family, response regulator
MNSFKVILVDDEPTAREGLESLLKKDAQINLVAKCSNGLEAINAIQSYQPQLVLLDIQMPEVSGFDVLQALTPPLPAIIFITAYDQFAIKAFEHHALDYLLKPFTDDRFYESINRAKKMLEQKQQGALSEKLIQMLSAKALDDDKVFNPSKSIQSKLAVKASGKIILIPYSEIDFIEADDYVVNIHYASKKAVIRESMKNMESTLPSDLFARTHKSFIINLKKVIEIENDIGGGLLLQLADKKTIPVSRNYRDAIATALGIDK